MSVSASIRPYNARDYRVVGTICVQTGNAGRDASGLYDSHDLLPALYAYPYVVHSPDLAWVVEYDGKVVGYVVGIADTREFSDWWVHYWRRELALMFEQTDGWSMASLGLLERGMEMFHRFTRLADDIGEATKTATTFGGFAYPAELRVDLLPEAQGKGEGEKLVRLFVNALARLGVPGVTVGIDEDNLEEQGFFKQIGFVPVATSNSGRQTGTIFMVARTDTLINRL